jgi:DNA-binding transcriptional LysR family regulator
MLDLRDLDCLVALSRHRHFAKAAQHCGLSQPAFSMRIRHLEERLNTRIVKRGNRFLGLTAEGEAILAHSRDILDRVRALEEETLAAKGEVVGSLVLGVIPTSAAYAGFLASRLNRTHPGLRIRIDTTNSLAIQQGVDAGDFDAGLTYSEGVSTDLLDCLPLYTEDYWLLLPEALAADKGDSITWAEAADLPLILLDPEMQNRRIVDMIFRDAGVHPQVVSETNGFTAAVVMAVQGMGATVIPRVLMESLSHLDGAVYLPLREPTAAKPVSLVTPRRDSAIPVVEALKRTARAMAAVM